MTHTNSRPHCLAPAHSPAYGATARRHPSWRRSTVSISCVLALALAGCSSDDDASQTMEPLTPNEVTHASWAASPQDYAEQLPFPGAPAPEPLAFDDQTLRQVIRLSAGGEALRVQLTNLFGDAPVSIDTAGVALSRGGSDIDPGSHVALTFGGAAEVTLA